jgi:hypothetical protein
MKDLELLHTDSTTFGEEIERLNRNFSKVSEAISVLERKYSHDKGWYPTEAKLKAAVQYAEKGDFAYVGLEFYYWEKEKWNASGITLSANFTPANRPPVFPEKLPIYYRGDSILVELGCLCDFASAIQVKANVFRHSGRYVSASLFKDEGCSCSTLEIRQDKIGNNLYFIIPAAYTRLMDLGETYMELATWFPSSVKGEEFVRRQRRAIFELSEFETIK